MQHAVTLADAPDPVGSALLAGGFDDDGALDLAACVTCMGFATPE